MYSDRAPRCNVAIPAQRVNPRRVVRITQKISYSHSQTKAFDNLRLRCISYSDCMDTVSGRELPNPLRDGVPVRVYGGRPQTKPPARGKELYTIVKRESWETQQCERGGT